MALHRHRTHADRGAAAGDIEVVAQPREQVGTCVNMQIDRIAHVEHGASLNRESKLGSAVAADATFSADRYATARISGTSPVSRRSTGPEENWRSV